MWSVLSFILDVVLYVPVTLVSWIWTALVVLWTPFSWLLYPDYNKRKVKALRPIVDAINALRSSYMTLSNEALRAKTDEFRSRLNNGESLDDLLVEAFATVKETARRVMGIEHYDEQLMAGIALHRGCMTEMKTGEGKTLAATTAVYLNALSGKGVHLATVNDYLAKRDSDEMSRIYSFLGLTCAALLENASLKEKQKIYALDIVYATGSTLGFDYLRDNMVKRKEEVCQRGLDYVIVDEADKLIDDGRTPLIISNPSEDSLEYYSYLMGLVESLQPGEYEIERSERSVYFTEEGLKKINSLLEADGVVEPGETLYSSGKMNLVHGLNQCLHANFMMAREKDYVVERGEVLLVDEHTGRILDGRRLSHGLHQALEAKERVEIHPEGKTSASVSYQKFFGLYKKFAGMSGTCLNEAEEFYEIYGVDTVSIPTHKPIKRIDEEDEIYLDFEDKFNAIVKEVEAAQSYKQPVLLITGSVELSEVFAAKFRQIGWKFNVLNAKRHKEEAKIIAQAGMPGAITIATNMAGRGTDIQLGGNLDMYVFEMREQGLSDAEIEARKPELKRRIQEAKKIVLDAGGLYVIGTERNESRRVDDQARGRAGRQGDPGRSKFLISLDDSLMKNFGNVEWMRWAIDKGEPVIDPTITRQFAKAQKSVEARSFEQRKYLLKYDAVLDEQRKMIYEFRRKYLFDEDLTYQLEKFTREKLLELSNNQSDSFVKKFKNLFGIEFSNLEEASKFVLDKMYKIDSGFFKRILLSTLDDLWAAHLSNLSYVQQVTHLRAHGQKDPLTEYKIEAAKLFENLLSTFVDESLYKAFHFEPSKDSFDGFSEDSMNFLTEFSDIISKFGVFSKEAQSLIESLPEEVQESYFESFKGFNMPDWETELGGLDSELKSNNSSVDDEGVKKKSVLKDKVKKENDRFHDSAKTKFHKKERSDKQRGSNINVNNRADNTRASMKELGLRHKTPDKSLSKGRSSRSSYRDGLSSNSGSNSNARSHWNSSSSSKKNFSKSESKLDGGSVKKRFFSNKANKPVNPKKDSKE